MSKRLKVTLRWLALSLMACSAVVQATSPAPVTSAVTPTGKAANGGKLSLPTPLPPNGPGSRIGQTQTTHLNCAAMMVRGKPAKANITWTWRWQAQSGGDPQTGEADACPCAWALHRIETRLLVDGEPLDC